MESIIENKVIIFSGLGTVIFGLAIYLGILISKLKRQNEKTKEMQAKLDAEIQKQDDYFKDSLVTLARAGISGQCDLSECCIRVKKILEYYPDIEDENDLRPVQDMYNEIKDFATHQQRLDLPKQEVYNQDIKRYKIEDSYREEFLKSLKKLIKIVEVRIHQ